MRVLIADDDALIIESMRRIFGVYFDEVLVARTGNDAWCRFERDCPDVVLLDISMPGESGLATARRIRKTDPDVPIAIITSHDGRDELMEAIPLGLVMFLVKPITMASLHILLHGYLAQLEQRGRLRFTLPDDVVYLPAEARVVNQGESWSLTRNEQRFIKLMLANRGKIVETAQICQNLTDYSGEEMSSQGLRNLVHRLRKKLGRDAFLTQKDIGYQLP